MITNCFSLVPMVPAVLSPPPCLLQLFSPFHSQCHHRRLDSHVLYSSNFLCFLQLCSILHTAAAYSFFLCHSNDVSEHHSPQKLLIAC